MMSECRKDGQGSEKVRVSCRTGRPAAKYWRVRVVTTVVHVPFDLGVECGSPGMASAPSLM